MTARSEEKIEQIRNDMGLSAATLNRKTREELRWYPYKTKVKRQLENDFQRRSDLIYWFLQQCNNLTLLWSGDLVRNERRGKHLERKRIGTKRVKFLIFFCVRNYSQEKITARTALCENYTSACMGALLYTSAYLRNKFFEEHLWEPASEFVVL